MTMIPAEYRIVLKDAMGNVMNPKLDAFSNIRYTRSVNNVGACTLIMGDNALIKDVNSWENFKVDGRVEIHKSVNGGAPFLDGETVYLIRKLERDLNENGQMTMKFTGEDMVGLLKRRISATKDKGKYAVISTATAADDALKTIWANYFGANADVVGVALYGATLGVGFRLDSLITQQASITPHAPTITKDFKNRTILQVMQEIAQTTTTAGTYLAFDIICDGSTMEFRTYVNQRGVDRRMNTPGALLLGPDAHNVSACHFEDDHTNEATYIVNGKGTPAVSTEREGVSPFGRIMKVMSSVATGTKQQMTADAQAQLRYNRPKKIMTATMIQTEAALYGVHYGYGDYVTVDDGEQQFDAHLDAVDTQIADGKDTVNCVFRGEYQAWL
jgi:hypothetical protein